MDDRVAKLWAEYSPRIEKAKAEDGRDRHRHFCDYLEERVGDFVALPLTLSRYLLLSQEGLFEDEEGDDARIPVLRFLWIVSPDFSSNPDDSARFVRKNRNIDPTPYPNLIREYLDNAFRYSPPRRETRTASGKATPKEWVSSIVDLIASEYGWTEQAILDLPITRLFLYVKRIRVRLGSDETDFSSEADRLQAEFMRRANEQN